MENLEGLEDKRRKAHFDFVLAKNNLRKQFTFRNIVNFGIKFKKLDDIDREITRLKLQKFREENE